MSDQAAPKREEAGDVAASPTEELARYDRTNATIAGKLRQAADILAAQSADPFRVSAYRNAARSLLGLREDIATITARGGRAAVEAVPGVGVSIAAAILEMLTTGRWRFLDHLRGSASSESQFRAVPGLGPKLCRKLTEAFGIDTLEGLEEAAYSGRLEELPGFGPRRAAMVRAALAEILGRVRAPPLPSRAEPPVAILLDVDREYRRRAAAGDLVKIAPKRFNPTGEAWLPVLHTARGGWHFTALYSNTPRAHRLDRIADWVVIYFHKDHAPEGQRTIVTERRGPRAGNRVVRGREAECLDLLAPSRTEEAIGAGPDARQID